MTTSTADLSAAGVSIWLDDLSRERINSGAFKHLIENLNVVGVTTNPSIFAAALKKGDSYATQVGALAEAGADVDQAVFDITTHDVAQACDIFAEEAKRTNGADGRVSIEVDPRLSRDTAGTTAEAKRLHAKVQRTNVLIKIPATAEGLEAISSTIAAGISVNVTLIFSVERYEAVLDAYLTGLERRMAAGGDLLGIESVASFFVSRVDTEVDRRLADLAARGDGQDLGADVARLHGQAAIANARLAYQVYEDALASERWKALAASGARMQRLLWASTGVKDKAFEDTRYVTSLVARDTVNTMPEATLQAVANHGRVQGDTIRGNYDPAHLVFDDLARLGVDMADVAARLEEQGIASFAKSWDELIASVTEQMEKAGVEVMPAGAVTPASGDGGQASAPAAGAPRQTASAART